jgi:hypothetical protein
MTSAPALECTGGLGGKFAGAADWAIRLPFNPTLRTYGTHLGPSLDHVDVPGEPLGHAAHVVYVRDGIPFVANRKRRFLVEPVDKTRRHSNCLYDD